MVEQGLKKIIGQYKYGQFNILDNGMAISYNPEDRVFKFDPFYNHAANITSGSCSELMIAAYHAIRQQYPASFAYRATGHDTNYFVDKASSHVFLLVSEEPLMDNQQIAKGPDSIEKILSANPILVDPSFGIVGRFSESGYKVKRIADQGVKMRYSDTLLLPHDYYVPLGLNSRKEMVYLGVNFDSESQLIIGFQSPRQKLVGVELRRKLIDTLVADDPEISRFIRLLRSREKKMSLSPLKKRKHIIIE